MAVFGAIEPVRALLLVPVAVLTGLAFAAPIQAFAAAQTNDSPFASLFRFVITPMFIFSGTFFPVTQLPDLLQVVAFLTPLWHGVALARGHRAGHRRPAPGASSTWPTCRRSSVVGLLASYRTFGQKLAE